MRTRLVLIMLVAALVLAAGPVSAASGRPISMALTGAAEVPGPGDPDASGTASLTLNQGLDSICFDISWAGINGDVFAGHIHAGTADVAGPVVVTLFTGSFAGTASVSGCLTTIDPQLIKAIRRDPASYYINVHSRPDFPAGAVRGQLGK